MRIADYSSKFWGKVPVICVVSRIKGRGSKDGASSCGLITAIVQGFLLKRLV